MHICWISREKNWWILNDVVIGEYFVLRDLKFYEIEILFALSQYSFTNVVAPNFNYSDTSCMIILVS